MFPLSRRDACWGTKGGGTITEAGPAVTNFFNRDQVFLSCISACLGCNFCKQEVHCHDLGSEGGTCNEYLECPDARLAFPQFYCQYSGFTVRPHCHSDTICANPRWSRHPRYQSAEVGTLGKSVMVGWYS
ncbi:MAG: alcohol dehydrogenase catalytic domain-containing protein [Planctomycetota bacterium]